MKKINDEISLAQMSKFVLAIRKHVYCHRSHVVVIVVIAAAATAAIADIVFV